MARRKNNHKEFKRNFLFIVCGDTEKDYINKVLKKIINNSNKKQFTEKLDTTIFQNDNANSISKTLETIKRKNNINCYTETFVVLDLEGTPENSKPFYDTYTKIKKEYDFKIITSLPSIEVWFLLHFNISAMPFDDGNDVVDKLKRKNLFSNYDKNLTADQINFLVENYEKAINNSQIINSEINSTVYPYNNEEFKNPHSHIYDLINDVLNS